MTFYIFRRHRVCLVDCVNLICSLYSWWEGFGSSSLATLPLGFNCGFISTPLTEKPGRPQFPFVLIFLFIRLIFLFGHSLSVPPPVQALRGLPCLDSFLCCSACQAHRGSSLAGALPCRLAHQTLKGAPWVGS